MFVFLSQDLMQFRLAWNVLCLQDSCFVPQVLGLQACANTSSHLLVTESFKNGCDITAICGRLKEKDNTQGLEKRLRG